MTEKIWPGDYPGDATDTVVLRDADVRGLVSRFNAGRARRVVINSAFGARCDSLDFLLELDRERFDSLSAVVVTEDDAAIGQLTQLERLIFATPGRSRFDLAGFRKLRALAVDSRRLKMAGLTGTGLHALSLENIEFHNLTVLPTGLDFLSFAPARKLRELTGIEAMMLKSLSICRNRTIEHWDPLASQVALRQLELIGVNLKSIAFVGSLSNLQDLILEDCGAIHGYDQLIALPSLKLLRCAGSTRIIDAPADGLERLRSKGIDAGVGIS